MRTTEFTVRSLPRGRTALGCGAVLLACAFLALLGEAAQALSISPLNGTPAASPQTQISFLGAPAGQISHVSVVASRSGRHRGRLKPYASAPGASFVPSSTFVQGEQVTASALAGPRGHARRVSSRFTIARRAYVAMTPMESPPKAKPGTVQSFVSQPSLHPPSVQVNVASSAPGGDAVFVAPTHGAGQWGPMIIDQTGQLVWFQAAPRGSVAMNLQAQSYEGQPVLAWWQGYISRLGLGLGTNLIYNSSYQPVARIAGGNGYPADLHELQITPQGSAFITAYTFVQADLSSGSGPRRGILVDCLIQEIDIKTGLVMFEWHAYGHVPLWDAYTTPVSGQPWDFFHVNSVSLDPSGDGNFIISSRNTWAAYEVSKHTGAILWRVGGKRPSFKMGPGTGTAWQHDARWQPDRTLTIFDNGSAPKIHPQSRVIRERIDWAHKTVTVVDRDVHTPALISGSQGNAEALDDGGVFVGWGEVPYMTEFSQSGQVLFDARLPAPGQTYRAYRSPWKGTPAGPPALAVRSTGPGTVTLYASWNGATEVRAWRVLAGPSSGSVAPVTTLPRNGFETAIPAAAAPWFAVQALGPGGLVLATSPPAHA
jgi:hypothetical protein